MKSFTEYLNNTLNESAIDDAKTRLKKYNSDFLKEKYFDNGYFPYYLGKGTSGLNKLKKYFQRKIFLKPNITIDYCLVCKSDYDFFKNKINLFCINSLENYSSDIWKNTLYGSKISKNVTGSWVGNSSYQHIRKDSVEYNFYKNHDWNVEDVFLLIQHTLPNQYKMSKEFKKISNKFDDTTDGLLKMLDALEDLENKYKI